MKTSRKMFAAASIAVAACTLTAVPAMAASDTTSGPLTVFADPFGNGTPNPITSGAAKIKVTETRSDKTILKAKVSGLPAGEMFHAHVHTTTCEENKGSGHYQDVVGGAVDDVNEAWFYFDVNRSGKSTDVTRQDWTFREGGANSVVIHGMKADGTAGAKLACINVDF